MTHRSKTRVMAGTPYRLVVVGALVTAVLAACSGTPILANPVVPLPTRAPATSRLPLAAQIRELFLILYAERFDL